MVLLALESSVEATRHVDKAALVGRVVHPVHADEVGGNFCQAGTWYQQTSARWMGTSMRGNTEESGWPQWPQPSGELETVLGKFC